MRQIKATLNLEFSDKCKKELSDRIAKGVMKALNSQKKKGCIRRKHDKSRPSRKT